MCYLILNWVLVNFPIDLPAYTSGYISSNFSIDASSVNAARLTPIFNTPNASDVERLSKGTPSPLITINVAVAHLTPHCTSHVNDPIILSDSRHAYGYNFLVDARSDVHFIGLYTIAFEHLPSTLVNPESIKTSSVIPPIVIGSPSQLTLFMLNAYESNCSNFSPTWFTLPLFVR